MKKGILGLGQAFQLLMIFLIFLFFSFSLTACGGGSSDEGDGGGGSGSTGTGSWTATSTTNAPPARDRHSAVWTGSEMIVWGGAADYYNSNPYTSFNTGGRYNPTTDTWTATPTTNAPTARYGHTAVWAGTEMIVWGGLTYNGTATYFNTGGRYNPSTDSWSATSTTSVPSARTAHSAVWTGTQMIVWGGLAANTGGRYNPSTDLWTATSTTSSPSARLGHTAVWTGTQMIIWGGSDGGIYTDSYFNTGGRYNPSTDLWTATSTTNAPLGRQGGTHTAVWTGSEMIVWGGYDVNGTNYTYYNTGGRYNPSTDSWTATSTTNAPSGKAGHTAVWTGSEMIVWDDTGGRYNPATDSWTATTNTNAPSGGWHHTAVWTGTQMIVWGGKNTNNTNTGGVYTP